MRAATTELWMVIQMWTLASIWNSAFMKKKTNGSQVKWRELWTHWRIGNGAASETNGCLLFTTFAVALEDVCHTTSITLGTSAFTINPESSWQVRWLKSASCSQTQNEMLLGLLITDVLLLSLRLHSLLTRSISFSPTMLWKTWNAISLKKPWESASTTWNAEASSSSRSHNPVAITRNLTHSISDSWDRRKSTWIFSTTMDARRWESILITTDMLQNHSAMSTSSSSRSTSISIPLASELVCSCILRSILFSLKFNSNLKIS